MLTMGNLVISTGRPSWTEISKGGYVHQLAIRDIVHAYPLSRSGHLVLSSDRGKVPLSETGNRSYGGHIGSNQNFTRRASRSHHRS